MFQLGLVGILLPRCLLCVDMNSHATFQTLPVRLDTVLPSHRQRYPSIEAIGIPDILRQEEYEMSGPRGSANQAVNVFLDILLCKQIVLFRLIHSAMLKLLAAESNSLPCGAKSRENTTLKMIKFKNLTCILKTGKPKES